jgi:molybdate transport system substrate-binding protein
LALWVPHQSSCDLSEALSEILRKIPPGKISLANPEHAPYGRAAREVLKSLELDSSLAPHLVLADNVAQALQFADSGGAAAAFVAVSLVRKGPASSRGRWRIVPAQHHRPIQQGGLVLPGGPGEPAASLFADWLQTPPARQILSDHGFLTSKE